MLSTYNILTFIPEVAIPWIRLAFTRLLKESSALPFQEGRTALVSSWNCSCQKYLTDKPCEHQQLLKTVDMWPENKMQIIKGSFSTDWYSSTEAW